MKAFVPHGVEISRLMKFLYAVVLISMSFVTSADSISQHKEIYRSPLRDINFSQSASTSQSREQKFYQDLKRSFETCRQNEGRNSSFRCFINAFPKKCEAVAQDLFSENSYKNRTKHFNCVSTCIDASWFETKFGDCSRTEFN